MTYKELRIQLHDTTDEVPEDAQVVIADDNLMSATSSVYYDKVANQLVIVLMS